MSSFVCSAYHFGYIKKCINSCLFSPSNPRDKYLIPEEISSTDDVEHFIDNLYIINDASVSDEYKCEKAQFVEPTKKSKCEVSLMGFFKALDCLDYQCETYRDNELFILMLEIKKRVAERLLRDSKEYDQSQTWGIED